MAKKNPPKNSPTINQRFTSLDRLVRAGFRQTDRRFTQIDGRFERVDRRLTEIDRRLDQVDRRFTQIDRRFERVDRRFNVVDLEFRDFRKDMNEKFAAVADHIDRLSTHIDGFMKLHETLDIELRVMKEQMNRFEERLKRVESAQAS